VRGTGESLEVSDFTRGDGGAEMLSSFIPSFQAGGEGTWNNSWPLSSARFAVLELVSLLPVMKKCKYSKKSSVQVAVINGIDTHDLLASTCFLSQSSMHP
jgi:hypothetical protein